MDENTPKDAITLGSIVKVRDIEEDFEETYEIVGSQEANPREGRISDDSPSAEDCTGIRRARLSSSTLPRAISSLRYFP